MATVSEQLRRAREEQKLNIYQVAEITKIKTDHIRALESGDFELFSAPVYIRGFVRTYAKALKLDVNRLLSDLDVELGQSERLREHPSLTGQREGVVDFLMLHLSKLNWRIVAATLAAALVILLTASAIRNRTKEKIDPLKNLGPGLYQTPSNQSGELLPLPKS